MSQYILNAEDSKQADALIRYLKSLDFIELKPVAPDKVKAVTQAKNFLNVLPDQPAKQADVNKAVKSIRTKHGYR